MHVETVRKVGAGFAVAAFGMCFWNIVTYGSNIGGSFTFLYIATALAIISQIFMIAVYSVSEHQRQSILRNKLIAIMGLLIVDVIFAIPSFQWIIKFTDYINLYDKYIDTSSFANWVTRWALALAFQVIATIMFIVYSRMHIVGSHVGAPGHAVFSTQPLNHH